MKKKKSPCIIAAVVAAMVSPIFCASAFACNHAETYVSIVKDEACTEEGQQDVICTECNAILESQMIPATGHSFGEYRIVERPSKDKNGLKVRTCKVCAETETKEYECPHEETDVITVLEPTCGDTGWEVTICKACETVVADHVLETLPHGNTHTVITKEPTCYETGIEAEICDVCGKAAEERTLDMTECTYGEWIYEKYATPFEAGKRYKECEVCGKKETGNYSITMEENSIYIPGTGINNRMAISSFTQSAINSNDMVYTEKAYAQNGENNPFVLGHYYGSLGNLYKTEIGQKIYLNRDGKIETYEVVVSEYAVEEYAGVKMIGQTTGTNIWDTFSSVIPSSYAIYGKPHGGKDLWEEDNDGKTLHIYTCHNKKEPWQSSDGSRGRWIVMAVLVSN